MTKKTRGKKKRSLKVPVVEVNISEACEHGCYVTWMGSPAVWRFAGTVGLETAPEDGVRFHALSCPNESCTHECWGED